MNELVRADLTTTSEIIAKNTGVEHAATIKLVRRHLQDLQEVGLVGFEIRPRLDGQHGGGNVRVWRLCKVRSNTSNQLPFQHVF